MQPSPSIAPSTDELPSLAHPAFDREIMKTLVFIVLILLSLVHYQLWFGDDSYATLTALRANVAQQHDQNAKLSQRNQRLTAEVADLKQGLAAIEERARLELGLIKRNEVFYQIVD